MADAPEAVTSYWWMFHARSGPGGAWSVSMVWPSKRTTISFCPAVVPGRAAKAKDSEYEAPGVVATV